MPLVIRILQPPLNEVFTTPGFLRALDRASLNRREWPDEGVQELFRILRKPDTLAKVCKRFGLFATEADEQHLREDWLGEGGRGWWPKQPMEAMLRAGMIRAIQLLREHDLPARVVLACREGHAPGPDHLRAQPPADHARDLDAAAAPAEGGCGDWSRTRGSGSSRTTRGTGWSRSRAARSRATTSLARRSIRASGPDRSPADHCRRRPAAIARSTSRFSMRSRIASRLSYSFLPRPSPSSALARPFTQ